MFESGCGDPGSLLVPYPLYKVAVKEIKISGTALSPGHAQAEACGYKKNARLSVSCY
jgi:hypothetical protein